MGSLSSEYTTGIINGTLIGPRNLNFVQSPSFPEKIKSIVCALYVQTYSLSTSHLYITNKYLRRHTSLLIYTKRRLKSKIFFSILLNCFIPPPTIRTKNKIQVRPSTLPPTIHTICFSPKNIEYRRNLFFIHIRSTSKKIKKFLKMLETNGPQKDREKKVKKKTKNIKTPIAMPPKK